MIELQDRDKKVLRLCYEQRFLTLEHVETEFEGAAPSEASRRITELESSGFVTRRHANLAGRRFMIELTRRGREIARSESPHQIRYSQPKNLVTLGHDALVTSVRQRLERLWTGTFIPEQGITEDKYRPLPDGLFQFPSGKRIVLEVENTPKWNRRFMALAHRWNYLPEVFVVLYVATSDDLARTLKDHLSKVQSSKPMGVVTFDELKTGTPSVWTVRGPLKLFSRKEH